MMKNPLADLDELARRLTSDPMVIVSPDPADGDRAAALIEASGFTGTAFVLPDNGSGKVAGDTT